MQAEVLVVGVAQNTNMLPVEDLEYLVQLVF